jgi:uncharacterized protein YecE (DUF72 family)
MHCDIRIGTSGYHYRHWLGTFYPQDLKTPRMLAYYLRYFDTVELNNSFYRLPTETAFDCWREAVPEGFVFAVKGSRFITHNKKLKDPENALVNLLPRAERLGSKLGPILWQLPPRWRLNLDRLEEFLQALPKKFRYAFEFRESSWHHPDVFALLRRHHAAYCIYQLAGYHTEHEITADWTYVRLHGPTQHKYAGSYTEQQLATWAKWIQDHARRLKAIYVYFDNDQAGYATHNALRLRQMVLGTGQAGLQPRDVDCAA